MNKTFISHSRLKHVIMDFQTNKEIRVFLSSTFSDMQNERDALVKLFRELSMEGLRRGISIRLVDLRWGVTDDQKRNGKVISTCLQEIDNSRPFFIGLIGDRYGWVPSVEEISLNPELTERYPEILAFCKEELSITEMEMRYGIKNSSDHSNSFFLIKKNTHVENERHAALISLISSSSIPHSFYEGIDEMTQRVREKMLKFLNDKYPLIEDITEIERYENNQSLVVCSSREGYVKYGNYIECLDDWCESGDQYLVLAGESGIGKTSLISEWIATHHFSKYKVVYHFIGNNLGDGSVFEAQRHILLRLEEEYRMTFESNYSSEDNDLGYELEQGFKEAEKHNDKWLIILDGVDHIENVAIAKMLLWLPENIHSAKFLITTCPSDLTYQRLCESKGYPTFMVEQPNVATTVSIIRQYLSKLGKALDEESEISIAHTPLFRQPHLLRLLLDELIAFGLHEKIKDFIRYYTNSKDKKDFYARIIAHTEDYYGKELVKKILLLIALTKDGIADEDIIEILHLTPLEWSMVYCGLKSHISLVNGKYRFIDRDFYFSIESYYNLSSEGEESFLVKQYTELLIRHLESESDEFEELAYQYYCANEWEKLYSILINSENMIKICLHGDKLFAEYWCGILENTTHSLRDYLNVDFHDLPDWDADEQVDFLTNVIDIQFGDKQLVIELKKKSMEMVQVGSNVTSDDVIQTSLVSTAQSHIELGNMEEAEVFLNKAERILEVSDKPKDSFFYFVKGNLEYAVGNYDSAIELYEEACRYEEEDGNDIPWKYINNKGLAFLNLNEYEDAQTCFEKALSIIKNEMTNQTVEAAILYNNLGLSFLNQGDSKHGEEMFLKSLEIINFNLLQESPIKINPLNNLGIIYLDRSDLEKAQETLSEAYRISKYCVPESPDAALTALNLGRVFVAEGDLENGENLLSESVAIYEKAVGFNHIYFGFAVIELMKVMIQRDNLNEALSFIDKVEKQAKLELDGGNLIEGYCRFYRSQVWLKRGKSTMRIKKELKKALYIFEDFECMEKYDEAKKIFDSLNDFV